MDPTHLWSSNKNLDNTSGRSLLLEILETKLDDCQLANETGKLFVPDGTLEQILDEDTVHHAMTELPIFWSGLRASTGDYAHKICNEKIPFRKILALLLLIDLPEAIATFVDLGINDLAFPMPDPRLVLSPELINSCNDKDSDRFNKWRSLAGSGSKRSCLRNIYVRQWCLLAPHFSRPDTILHYTFTNDHVLPFLRNDLKSPGHSKLSDSLNEVVRYGSFSEVRRVKIHPNHYDFGDYGVSNPDHQFAVKRLRAHDYEDFTQEIEVFKRHWRSHIHIVPLLATYEIQETVDDNPIRNYCLIFPWAAGDLRSFWDLNEDLVQHHEIIPWIFRECHEITRALSHIHGDLPHSAAWTDSFGRHGDIKPSNILWYPNATGTKHGDLGKLVLADFGLADFHRANSRTNSRTDSLPRSITYHAPEFDTTKIISPAIDIWALGCTFLEFITWFLKGNQAVQCEFREFRSEPDIYGIYSDIFFKVQHHEGHDDVLLKPQVLTWIRRLCNERPCSKYLKDFLDIIQYNMLVVDLPKRQTADVISRKLEELHLRCASDVNYYQGLDSSVNSRIATSQPPVPTSQAN